MVTKRRLSGGPGNADEWLPAQLARRGRTWNANRAARSLQSTL
jgi:hypothetical protein